MAQKQKDKVVARVKINLNAGKATPAYPIGPTLGGYGINLGAVVKEYNDRTSHQVGLTVPVLVTIFGDRSFSLQILSPTTAALIRQAANVLKGSGTPSRSVAGQITRAQLREIARLKLEELNTADIEAAMRSIAGTARSMGIAIADAEALDRPNMELELTGAM